MFYDPQTTHIQKLQSRVGVNFAPDPTTHPAFLAFLLPDVAPVVALFAPPDAFAAGHALAKVAPVNSEKHHVVCIEYK